MRNLSPCIPYRPLAKILAGPSRFPARKFKFPPKSFFRLNLFSAYNFIFWPTLGFCRQLARAAAWPAEARTLLGFLIVWAWSQLFRLQFFPAYNLFPPTILFSDRPSDSGAGRPRRIPAYNFPAYIFSRLQFSRAACMK